MLMKCPKIPCIISTNDENGGVKMIGEQIRKTREKNGLTQSSLAKRLGISRSAVNAWELGVSVPSAQYLVELSKLFKVSTDYLLGLTEREMVDISGLADEEKKMVYSFLDYFDKYGNTVRNINRQVEDHYDEIRKVAEKMGQNLAKEILEEVMSMRELFE